MLVWPIAAKAPSTIEAMAMKTMICCHSAIIDGNAPNRMFKINAMAATLGAPAKKAVTGVGAPS